MDKQDIAKQFVNHFEQVLRESMCDMPIVNSVLSVDVTSTRMLGERQVFVLVTPWFMSVVCVPISNIPAQKWQIGTSSRVQFPSGSYEFTRAYIETLGIYESCSLYSPMFEFESQQQALTVAQQSLQLLWEEDVDQLSLNGSAKPDIQSSPDQACMAPTQPARRQFFGKLAGRAS